jgi:hypothetical protein
MEFRKDVSNFANAASLREISSDREYNGSRENFWKPLLRQSDRLAVEEGVTETEGVFRIEKRCCRRVRRQWRLFMAQPAGWRQTANRTVASSPRSRGRTADAARP